MCREFLGPIVGGGLTHFINFQDSALVSAQCRVIIDRNFRQFRHPLIGENFIVQIFLPCVKDSIEDMATFTALVKNNFFCNTKVPVAGRNFFIQ